MTLLIAGGVIALVILGGLALALNNSKPAGESTPRTRAQAQIRTVSDELDLFAIAYAASDPAQQAGAGPALQRARAAFNAALPDLKSLDSAAADRWQAALTGIEQQAAARAPAAGLTATVQTLRGDLRTWLNTP
jgi:hypothetical protein